MIHSDSFGSTLAHLQFVFIDFNNLNTIDAQFFDNASTLDYLYLIENICINRNFYAVNILRDQTREALTHCFDNFAAAGAVNCFYAEYPNPGDYSCILSANNPSGSDNFTQVTGDHASGFGNDDVRAVEGANQNTRIVPSVVCEQFSNLIEFSLHTSQIMRITRNSFSGCANIRTIMLNNNLITSIEAESFDNNANLEHFEAILNDIHHVAASVFASTNLQTLFLGGNRLRSIDGSFLVVTLRNLYLYENNLRFVGENSFESLASLEILDLGLNPGIELPANVFNALENLQILLLDHSNLAVVNENWLQSLVNLREIFLQGNQITELQNRLFAALNALEVLFIGENPLESLSSAHFDENVLSLQRISAMETQISAINEGLFDNAVNLTSLYLYGSPCGGQNFFNIQDNRDEVREQLEGCFDTFRGSVLCNFIQYGGHYNCILLINNIAGHHDFGDIPGDHTAGLTNGDVTLVESLSQSTRNIPSILCRQFENLAEIFIESSGIRRITVENCVRLERLTLAYNQITSIDSGTFATNENLSFLDLRMNQITSIASDAFAGSNLAHLDLSSNNLGAFNSDWVIAISSSLRELFLYENNISEIAENSFETLPNLLSLDLGLNPNVNIHSDAFNGLNDLRFLFVDTSNMRNLNSQWFASLLQLAELHIHTNLLRTIPENAFTTLTNLAYLSVRNNRLTNINSNAFSSEMSNLTRFYAQSNRINAIDELFFESNEASLNLLYLFDNLCVNMNFYNVNEFPDIAREELRGCFNNFQDLN